MPVIFGLDQIYFLKKRIIKTLREQLEASFCLFLEGKSNRFINFSLGFICLF